MVIRTAIKAIKLADKVHQHYKKYKPIYDTAYASAPAIYDMAKKYTGKRKRGKNSNGGNKAATKRSKTWGMSSSAYKKTDKKTSKRNQKSKYVDGTITTSKAIKYKPAKFSKQISLQGGKYLKEISSTGICYHQTTDEIYSQKVQLLDFLFDGGVPVVAGQNITSIMNDMYAQQTTTAPLYSSGAIVASKSEGMKVYLGSAQWELEFTNMSAGATELTIYVVMCKNTKSTGTGPTTDWTNGLIAEQGSQLTAPNSSRIGNKPWSSKLFNTNYKVVSSKSFNAGPGAKINYNFYFAPRSVVDTTYFVRNNQVSGLTYGLFIVTHGQLGLGVGNVVVPKPVQWLYNIRKKYMLKTVNSFPTVLSQTVAESMSVSAAGAVAVMEDDGDLES